MKFKFPFQNVLKHRKILENIAEREFHQALALLNGEITRVEEMKNEVRKAHTHSFERQTSGGTAGPALSQVYEFLTGQDVRIERQQQKVQELQKRVEEMREILRLKAIDYKMIESLKDKKKADFNKLENLKQQKFADEISSMRARKKVE